MTIQKMGFNALPMPKKQSSIDNIIIVVVYQVERQLE
jgi:hypothetical protein